MKQTNKQKNRQQEQADKRMQELETQLSNLQTEHRKIYEERAAL